MKKEKKNTHQSRTIRHVNESDNGSIETKRGTLLEKGNKQSRKEDQHNNSGVSVFESIGVGPCRDLLQRLHECVYPHFDVIKPIFLLIRE